MRPLTTMGDLLRPLRAYLLTGSEPLDHSSKALQLLSGYLDRFRLTRAAAGILVGAGEWTVSRSRKAAASISEMR